MPGFTLGLDPISDWVAWQIGQTGLPGQVKSTLDQRHARLNAFDPTVLLNPMMIPGFPTPVSSALQAISPSRPTPEQTRDANNSGFFTPYSKTRASQAIFGPNMPGQVEQGTSLAELLNLLAVPATTGPMSRATGIPAQPGTALSQLLFNLGQLNVNPMGPDARSATSLYGHSRYFGPYPPTVTNPALQQSRPVQRPLPTPVIGSGYGNQGPNPYGIGR